MYPVRQAGEYPRRTQGVVLLGLHPIPRSRMKRDWNQKSLFGDPHEGEELKAEGMEKVLSHTPEEYREKFLNFIYRYPHSSELTVDDIIAVVGLPPNDHNAVGSLMREAAEAGMIVFTGKYTKSQRSIRHSGNIKIWKRT